LCYLLALCTPLRVWPKGTPGNVFKPPPTSSSRDGPTRKGLDGAAPSTLEHTLAGKRQLVRFPLFQIAPLLFLITRGPNFSSSHVQNSFCSVVLIRVIPAASPTPFLSCSCPSPLLCFTFIDPSFSACTVLLIVRLTLS